MLSLGEFDSSFKKGKSALEYLTQYVLTYFREVKADEKKLNAQEHFFFKQYTEATDEFGKKFTDERIATTVVLMIWDAYIEAAALISQSVFLLGQKANDVVLKRA